MSGADRPGPRVTAVIVTYNSMSTIDAALDSIRPAHDSGLLECIVVDNTSRDETVAHVREHQSWVRVKTLEENVGFGRGCNVGAKLAAGDLVLFLNPDAALPRDSIERLVRHMDARPRCGLAGPAVDRGGHMEQAGGLPTPGSFVRSAAGRGDRYPGRRTIEPGAPPFRTDWLSGGALLARGTALHELGGFDPRFFLYFEETDLCRRAADAGWELWAVGEAVGDHAAGASARSENATMYGGCIAEHYFASRFYYMRKHHGMAAALGMEIGELLLLGLRGLRRLLRREPLGEIPDRVRHAVPRTPRRVPAGAVGAW